jgi:hypothetical protein
MFRLGIALFVTIFAGDCWQPIIVDAGRTYAVKREGKLHKTAHEDREQMTRADLVIDGDSSNVIRAGYSVPLGDTVVIELFETTISYHHLFDIIILEDRYAIRYVREINETDLVQVFECTKSRIVFNSSDFSNNSQIRGYVEYTGRCLSGCSDKHKLIKISGNFSVEINRY